MTKLRPKSAVLDAMQWNGPQDNDELRAFAGHWASIGCHVFVTTGDATVRVFPGDWVVKRNSMFFVCPDETLMETYEVVLVPTGPSPAHGSKLAA